jgi:hypothetical protein
VRVTLGKQSEMALKGARIAAAKAQEQIRAGVDRILKRRAPRI